MRPSHPKNKPKILANTFSDALVILNSFWLAESNDRGGDWSRFRLDKPGLSKGGLDKSLCQPVPRGGRSSIYLVDVCSQFKQDRNMRERERRERERK